mmetsp:Transcript_77037/g.140906  ORF Transcript_77037/g.140906 Transcript_77037/m.140906 type:complete len:279 (-) Transcript_77037:587-1423(-)
MLLHHASASASGQHLASGPHCSLPALLHASSQCGPCVDALSRPYQNDAAPCLFPPLVVQPLAHFRHESALYCDSCFSSPNGHGHWDLLFQASPQPPQFPAWVGRPSLACHLHPRMHLLLQHHPHIPPLRPQRTPPPHPPSTPLRHLRNTPPLRLRSTPLPLLPTTPLLHLRTTPPRFPPLLPHPVSVPLALAPRSPPVHASWQPLAQVLSCRRHLSQLCQHSLHCHFQRSQASQEPKQQRGLRLLKHWMLAGLWRLLDEGVWRGAQHPPALPSQHASA